MVAKNISSYINLILYIKFLQCYTTQTMQLYDYFIKPFTNSTQQQHIFEYNVYKILKQKPLKAQVNYLAMPWIELNHTGKLYNTRIREFKKALHIEKKLNGGFTVSTYFNGPNDPLPETKRIFKILNELGIDCVFTTDAFEGIDSYMGIKIEPLPLHVENPVDPNTPKDITCSFIGFISHSIRRFAEPLGQLGGYYIRLRDNARAFYFIKVKQTQEELRTEYLNIIARSRFSLCIRGFEPGLFRFWESLQAGAIPILISDNWRLPEGFSWNTCIIRIKQEDFKRNPLVVEEAIRGISPRKEIKMRRACLAAYEQFSGERIIDCIRRYYDKD